MSVVIHVILAVSLSILPLTNAIGVLSFVEMLSPDGDLSVSQCTRGKAISETAAIGERVCIITREHEGKDGELVKMTPRRGRTDLECKSEGQTFPDCVLYQGSSDPAEPPWCNVKTDDGQILEISNCRESVLKDNSSDEERAAKKDAAEQAARKKLAEKAAAEESARKKAAEDAAAAEAAKKAAAEEAARKEAAEKAAAEEAARKKAAEDAAAAEAARMQAAEEQMAREKAAAEKAAKEQAAAKEAASKKAEEDARNFNYSLRLPMFAKKDRNDCSLTLNTDEMILGEYAECPADRSMVNLKPCQAPASWKAWIEAERMMCRCVAGSFSPITDATPVCQEAIEAIQAFYDGRRGRLVRVRGLPKDGTYGNSGLNGKYGELENFNHTTGRWIVKLDGSSTGTGVHILPDHLEAQAFYVGRRVRVHDPGRTEHGRYGSGTEVMFYGLNGRYGQLVENRPIHNTERWRVKLADGPLLGDGSTVDIQRDHLQAQATKQTTPAEEAVRQKAVEEEAARKRTVEEEAARKREVEEEATRRTAAAVEAAKQKTAAAEAARNRAAEEEAARKRAAEEEAARQKAAAEEEEAARKRAVEEEAARKREVEEEATRRKAAAVEAAKQKTAAEEADFKRAAEEEAARKRAAEEEAARQKAAAEEEAPSQAGSPSEEAGKGGEESPEQAPNEDTANVTMQVTVSMTLENVTLDQLDEASKTKLRTGVQQAVAEEAGVEPSAVSVTLSAGSVIITCNISSPDANLGAKLHQSASLQDKVLQSAKEIKGVVAAATGEMQVSGPIVTEVDGAKAILGADEAEEGCKKLKKDTCTAVMKRKQKAGNLYCFIQKGECKSCSSLEEAQCGEVSWCKFNGKKQACQPSACAQGGSCKRKSAGDEDDERAPLPKKSGSRKKAPAQKDDSTRSAAVAIHFQLIAAIVTGLVFLWS